MNGDSPSPAACFLRGETRIVMPSLVEELVGTIRKIARREGGDRVEDLSDLSRGCLGLGDLPEERCPLFFSHGSILEGFCRISTPPPRQDLMAAMKGRETRPTNGQDHELVAHYRRRSVSSNSSKPRGEDAS